MTASGCLKATPTRLVVDPLIGKAVGTNLATQPTDSELRTIYA
jgi:hypothetical protein